MDMLPALATLKDSVQDVAKAKGYLRAVDSRWGRVRKSGRKIKEHTALNVLLQMTGSLVVKYALVLAVRQIREEDMEFRGVVNMHDEWQCEIPEEEVEYVEYHVDDWKVEEKREYHDGNGRMYSAPRIILEDADGFLVRRAYHRQGQISAEAMTRAGEMLGIRTPLAGEYKIGRNWYDTH